MSTKKNYILDSVNDRKQNRMGVYVFVDEVVMGY